MSKKKYRLVKDGLARVKSIFTFETSDDPKIVEKDPNDYIWTEDVKHEIEFVEWSNETIDTLEDITGFLGLTDDEFISLETALTSHFEDNVDFMKNNPDISERIESGCNKIVEMDMKEKK